MNTRTNNGLGVGVGLFLCGLVLVTFPKFIGLISWASWLFWLIGLLVLLVGIMGICMETFKAQR